MALAPVDARAELDDRLAEAAAESAPHARGFEDVVEMPETELQRLVTKILGDLGGPLTYVGDNDWLIDRWGLISVFPGGVATAGCRACQEHCVGAKHNGVDDEDHLRLVLVECIKDILQHRSKCEATDKWVSSVIFTQGR